ncbi:MaoC family dehydratase [Inmirania thermothiophila]|uniref:3-hydroxybutyryl-CoA dehydratase n=1 Tax=Inmirania thermothiophila TaxID=1750597 RepID=A0A3N1Y548_9GAMM|nr:MaoC family dehydratase [Inmirania thermothiophila]ROR32407.1 3-hydroxybutyryl-CoA dehydratase [Inmirania thermothiophila]
MIIGRTVEELEVGQKAAFEKTISESDVYLFAGITGDLNPAHVNEVQASQTVFKGRIAHGILTAGLISAVLAMQLPGPGSIYVSQDLRFKAPVRIGDTVRAEVEVLEVDVARNRCRLATRCYNQDGTLVLDGEAVVMPPKRPRGG